MCKLNLYHQKMHGVLSKIECVSSILSNDEKSLGHFRVTKHIQLSLE